MGYLFGKLFLEGYTKGDFYYGVLKEVYLDWRNKERKQVLSVLSYLETCKMNDTKPEIDSAYRDLAYTKFVLFFIFDFLFDIPPEDSSGTGFFGDIDDDDTPGTAFQKILRRLFDPFDVNTRVSSLRSTNLQYAFSIDPSSIKEVQDRPYIDKEAIRRQLEIQLDWAARYEVLDEARAQRKAQEAAAKAQGKVKQKSYLIQ